MAGLGHLDSMTTQAETGGVGVQRAPHRGKPITSQAVLFSVVMGQNRRLMRFIRCNAAPDRV